MESVEMTLKNSGRKEKPLTAAGTTQNGDDFSVDDLLDFSNDDVFVEDDKTEQLKKGNDGNTLDANNEIIISTTGEEFGSLPTSELSVPMDDLAELEWLSNFVDDSSFTAYSAPTKKPVWLTGNRRHPVPPVNDVTCVKPPLPVKIRSKRARTGVRVWSNGSSSLTDTSSSSSSSSSSGPWLYGGEFLDEHVVKSHQKTKTKKKKKKQSEIWENVAEMQTQTQTQTQSRRCSHCGVQKTPQWRAGPNGPKTLCNACGVRYKSGRLLPEYRPACSPTFSSELHSNSHRKVIEMRRKKEMSGGDADDTGLSQTVQVVPSF